MLHALWCRLQTALRRRSVEEDLDDDVRFHLDRETAKHVAHGVPLAEARRRARQSFVQLDVVKEVRADRALAFDVLVCDAGLHQLIGGVR